MHMHSPTLELAMKKKYDEGFKAGISAQIVAMRRCSWCDEIKPASLEHFYRKRKAGFQPWCKACGPEVARFQRQKLKERKQAEARQ